MSDEVPQFVIEHQPPEPIHKVIQRLPSPNNYPVGTILRITAGPYEGQQLEVKEGGLFNPGNYWYWVVRSNTQKMT